MEHVGIKVLKNRLSEYIRMAEAGDTILVTDRGRVVARIGPPNHPQSAREVLDDLVRRGVATPATRRGEPIPEGRGTMKLEDLLRDLDEDRADRW